MEKEYKKNENDELEIITPQVESYSLSHIRSRLEYFEEQRNMRIANAKTSFQEQIEYWENLEAKAIEHEVPELSKIEEQIIAESNSEEDIEE